MKPGDDCPQQGCKGHIIVRQSQRRGESLVRYLRCWKCNYDAGKVAVRHTLASPRRKRS